MPHLLWAGLDQMLGLKALTGFKEANVEACESAAVNADRIQGHSIISLLANALGVIYACHHNMHSEALVASLQCKWHGPTHHCIGQGQGSLSCCKLHVGKH